MSERVFVRGFDYGTSEDAIKAHFEQAGPVATVELWGKGAAVVTYDSSESAQAAVKLDRSIISGNSRFVEVKVDEDPKSSRCRVFVRGFDFGTTDEQLEAHCSQAGQIEKVQWCSKGSAIVTYSSPEQAAQAISSLNKTTIQGNTRFIDVMVKEDGNGFFDMRRMRGMPPPMYWFANLARLWGKGKGKGKSRRSEDPPGSGRVFVRGFDFGTTDEQLMGHMSTAGEVADVHWVTRGSAVVIYKEADSAKKATEALHKSVIGGNSRYIDVILKDSE
ncbi:Squamous cell carcinoma antigen recognized by T-cells 3 (SART-3) (mSART-3) (Tumor-rejection antigen SART3) [Durusdinium trenchii]|uniref:Squamous cell carcinoma antigen recognized by T-cells 3 (SART-3) (MSART-3) (Tumor-rejection antigen SART3) n=1 Tax=Durusdinium trenchii TaxID=1381693 RepID=A0ABP0QDW9_9DINO